MSKMPYGSKYCFACRTWEEWDRIRSERRDAEHAHLASSPPPNTKRTQQCIFPENANADAAVQREDQLEAQRARDARPPSHGSARDYIELRQQVEALQQSHDTVSSTLRAIQTRQHAEDVNGADVERLAGILLEQANALDSVRIQLTGLEELRREISRAGKAMANGGSGCFGGLSASGTVETRRNERPDGDTMARDGGAARCTNGTAPASAADARRLTHQLERCREELKQARMMSKGLQLETERLSGDLSKSNRARVHLEGLLTEARAAADAHRDRKIKAEKRLEAARAEVVGERAAAEESVRCVDALEQRMRSLEADLVVARAAQARAEGERDTAKEERVRAVAECQRAVDERDRLKSERIRVEGDRSAAEAERARMETSSSQASAQVERAKSDAERALAQQRESIARADRASAELKDARLEITALKERLSEAQADADRALSDRAAAMQGKASLLDEMDAAMNEMTGMREAVEQQNAQLRVDLDAARVRLLSLERELGDERDKTARAEIECDTMKERLASIERASSVSEGSAHSKLHDLRTENSLLRRRVDALEKRTVDLEACEVRASELREECVSLKRKAEAGLRFEEELRQRRAEIAQLQSQCVAAEHSQRIAEESVARLTAEVDSLKTARADLTRERNGLRTKVKSLQGTADGLAGLRSDLEAAADAMRREITERDVRLGDCERARARLEDQRGLLQREAADLERRVESLQMSLEAAGKQRAALEETIATMREALAKLKESHNAAARYDALHEELGASRQRMEEEIARLRRKSDEGAHAVREAEKTRDKLDAVKGKKRALKRALVESKEEASTARATVARLEGAHRQADAELADARSRLARLGYAADEALRLEGQAKRAEEMRHAAEEGRRAAEDAVGRAERATAALRDELELSKTARDSAVNAARRAESELNQLRLELSSTLGELRRCQLALGDAEGKLKNTDAERAALRGQLQDAAFSGAALRSQLNEAQTQHVTASAASVASVAERATAAIARAAEESARTQARAAAATVSELRRQQERDALRRERESVQEELRGASPMSPLGVSPDESDIGSPPENVDAQSRRLLRKLKRRLTESQEAIRILSAENERLRVLASDMRSVVSEADREREDRTVLQTLRGRISDLDRELAVASEERAHLAGQLRGEKERRRELQRDAAAAIDAAERERAACMQLDAQCAAFAAERADAQHVLSANQAEIGRLHDECARERARGADVERQLLECRQALDTAQAVRGAIEADAQSGASKAARKLERMRDALALKEREVAAAHNEIAAARAREAQLVEDVSAERRAGAARTLESEDRERQLRATADEVVRAAERVRSDVEAELRRVQAEWERDRGVLQAAIAEAERQRSQTKDELDAAEGKYASALQRVSEVEREIASARSAVLEKEAERGEYEARLRRADQLYADLASRVGDADTQRFQAEARAAEAKVRIAENDTVVSVLQRTESALRGEVADLRSKLRSAEDACAQLETRLRDSEAHDAAQSTALHAEIVTLRAAVEHSAESVRRTQASFQEARERAEAEWLAEKTRWSGMLDEARRRGAEAVDAARADSEAARASLQITVGRLERALQVERTVAQQHVEKAKLLEATYAEKFALLSRDVAIVKAERAEAVRRLRVEVGGSPSVDVRLDGSNYQSRESALDGLVWAQQHQQYPERRPQDADVLGRRIAAALGEDHSLRNKENAPPPHDAEEGSAGDSVAGERERGSGIASNAEGDVMQRIKATLAGAVGGSRESLLRVGGDESVPHPHPRPQPSRPSQPSHGQAGGVLRGAHPATAVPPSSLDQHVSECVRALSTPGNQLEVRRVGDGLYTVQTGAGVRRFRAVASGGRVLAKVGAGYEPLRDHLAKLAAAR